MFVIIKRQELTDTWKNQPTVIHATLGTAKKEAKRLAETNLATVFDVYELDLVGSTVAVTKVIWTGGDK